MEKITIISSDFCGKVDIVRYACRGIIVRDDEILIGYETNVDQYIIPGGGVEDNETLKQCVEREVKEETGAIVKANKKILKIEEFFENIHHINYYFICNLIKLGDELNLTKAEKEVNLQSKWIKIDKLIDIFSKYEDYKDNIPKYGLYKREYNALLCFLKHM